MRYYPISVDLQTQRCLVVGGGDVAERKVETLLRANGVVTVISPALTPRLQLWAEDKRITAFVRPYIDGDLNGFSLVFAATDDEALQRRIAADARAAGILINVVDRPALCSFIVPALVLQGDLTVAVSTGGASPALAKKIRHDLEQHFGPEYALALVLLARVRELVTREVRSLDERQRLFTALVESPLLDYLRNKDTDQVNALLQQIVGMHCTCTALGVTLYSDFRLDE
jgi:precorrin-2 dehydrogenase / sirohydrochlorin ferrochelatase